MLLSQANLHALSNNKDDKLNRDSCNTATEEHSKLERIISYIHDQKSHARCYRSPNHHHPSESNNATGSDQEDSSIVIIDTINYYNNKNEKDRTTLSIAKEEHINNQQEEDDHASLFSASISQVMARKRQQEEQNAIKEKSAEKPVLLSPSSTDNNNNNKKYHPINQSHRNSISSQLSSYNNNRFVVGRHHHRKNRNRRSNGTRHQDHHNNTRRYHHRRKKSPSTHISDHILCDTSKSAKLPQTRANGFHLLHKFVSPNLEVSRITIQSHQNTHKRPKLGLFNKGKSSSKATKAVPDLVFSESKFLKKSNNISKRNNPTARSTIPSSYESFYQSNYRKSLSDHEKRQQQSNSISKYFKPKPHPQSNEQQEVQQRSLFHNNNNTGSLYSANRKRVPNATNQSCDNSNMYSGGGLSIERIQQQGREIYAKRRRILLADDKTISSSSNKSIAQLLEECKNAPPVIFEYEKRFNYSNHPSHHYNNNGQNYGNNNHVTTSRTVTKDNYTTSHIQQQVPSYSRVKTPTKDNGNGNVFNFKQVSSSSKSNNNEEEPILIESSNNNEDDVATSSYLRLEKEDDNNLRYDLSSVNNKRMAPAVSVLEEEVVLNNRFQSYMYESDDVTHEDWDDSHNGVRQPEEEYPRRNNPYNTVFDEWQVENSIISFSGGHNSNEQSDYTTGKEVTTKEQYKDNNTDNILNFWRSQYRRTL